MNWRSEHIWVELLKGSRKRGNFFWACILFLGSLGFLSVGISSYLGKNIISILPRSYGYGKYRISDPSGKRRETDTQFKSFGTSPTLPPIPIDQIKAKPI
uniref:Photosystem I assembly protein Ycf4 n=1 Tax=Aegilops tauschii subsp. strangulata TaxID=200361 RepID=A0A453FW32_AEGTS